MNATISEGMIAERVTIRGPNGDASEADAARPLGAGPFPADRPARAVNGWQMVFAVFDR